MDVYNVLNNIINKYNKPINKSFTKNYISSLETIIKSRDYSKLVLKEITDRNGKRRRVWVDPETDLDRDNVKMFDDEQETKKQKEGYGYYEKLADDTDEYLTKPLLNKFESVEKIAPGLTKLIEKKYQDYYWDKDCKEMDLELDYQMADYYQKKLNATQKKESDKQGDLFSGEFVDTKSKEELENELYNEFQKKTHRNIVILNGRKRDMARLKENSPVKYNGFETKIVRFNDRKFPVIINKKGEEQTVFYETIVDPESIMERINKQSERMAKRKAKKEGKKNESK